MEAERLVHQKMLTGIEEPSEDEIDMFEDDIDLFNHEGNGADFSIEAAEPSSLRATDARDDEDELGDNVELF